jgi:hypothetical protein
VGHKLSLVPFVSVIAFAPTGVAALLDTVDGFLNKGIRSGTKAMFSGAADTAVTATVGAGMTVLGSATGIPTLWTLGSIGSSLIAGDTFGELARKGTKGVMDAVISDSTPPKTPSQLAREAQVLGPNPTTIGHVPAAIGYAAMPQQPQMLVNPITQEPMQPNQWANAEAQRRGQSPQQARENWLRNNHEDAIALQNATQQPAQLGAS